MTKNNLSTKEELEVFEYKEDIKGTALINSYTIYGRFFNIEGELEGNHSELSLVMKNENNEIEIPINVEIKDNKTIFKTNKLINEGINLETIKKDDFTFYLKENDNYYSLKNNTKYQELEYYTITNNQTNYKIIIDFINLDNQEYLYLKTTKVKLPKDIYDIVIDPGHGGVDVGATSNGYNESKINLEYSLLLKKQLEKLGFKVKLTRESDKSITNYGKNGRVSIPYKTKAKLLLSIHMNSASNVKNGGVEVYVPNNADINFAKEVANNIVAKTSSNYSPNNTDKIEKGVYLRTLSKEDLKTMEKDAKEDGYTPYENATIASTYYYIIRETGGIVTGSYIDNRNPKKDGNPYVNSNHGCESYLLELGFMNSKSNLNILLNEKDKYVEAITLSIQKYLKIE